MSKTNEIEVVQVESAEMILKEKLEKLTELSREMLSAHRAMVTLSGENRPGYVKDVESFEDRLNSLNLPRKKACSGGCGKSKKKIKILMDGISESLKCGSQEIKDLLNETVERAEKVK